MADWGHTCLVSNNVIGGVVDGCRPRMYRSVKE